MPNPQCRLLGSAPRHQALGRAGMDIFMLSLVASLHEGRRHTAGRCQTQGKTGCSQGRAKQT